MALAKYAEDNLEMYYERMAMTEHTVFQDYKPSYSTEKTVPAKNEQKKEMMNFVQCLLREVALCDKKEK